MRKALKRERMIELMGEGKRYFDIRRWKDAPVEESLQIYGCNVFVGEVRETNSIRQFLFTISRLLSRKTMVMAYQT